MKISVLKIKYYCLLTDRDLVSFVSKITIYLSDTIIKEIISIFNGIKCLFPSTPVQPALLN